MTVHELNRDQLIELKQAYWIDEHDGEQPDYYTLANIDEIVSDKEVQDAYCYDTFVNDDFACTAGEPEEEKIYSFGLGDLTGTDVEIADELREIARAIENDYSHGMTGRGTSWYIEEA